jgi:hypothetical protein
MALFSSHPPLESRIAALQPASLDFPQVKFQQASVELTTPPY